MGTRTGTARGVTASRSAMRVLVSGEDFDSLKQALDDARHSVPNPTEAKYLKKLQKMLDDGEERYGGVILSGGRNYFESLTTLPDSYTAARLARGIEESDRFELFQIERDGYGEQVAREYEDPMLYIREKELTEIAKRLLKEDGVSYNRSDLQDIVSRAKSFLYQWGPDTEEELEAYRINREAREEFYRDGLYEMRDDIGRHYPPGALEGVEDQYGVDPLDVDTITAFTDYHLVSDKTHESPGSEIGDLCVEFKELPAEEMNRMTDYLKGHNNFRTGPAKTAPATIAYYFKHLSDRSVPIKIYNNLDAKGPFVRRVKDDFGISYDREKWSKTSSGYTIYEITKAEFNPDINDTDLALKRAGAKAGDLVVGGSFWKDNKEASSLLRSLKRKPNYKGTVATDEDSFMIFRKK